ncbi:unnamed protein product [Clonostachys rhizophaga]|uniref:Clr5 domain-containing protein n=1 Tax=Clonostachys rhizophaga TaxID=160324 RepID=A0A9N9V971_9HYPO|nr:unnamed protein product [Clonostachys rhizophaga]
MIKAGHSPTFVFYFSSAFLSFRTLVDIPFNQKKKAAFHTWFHSLQGKGDHHLYDCSFTMENFIHCSHHPISKPSRLWAASSFQYGDAGALQIDHANDGDEYDLHLDLGTQHVSHPLMVSHAQGDNLDPSIFFIPEPQEMQRDPLIRYTLNPDLVNTLRDDYGPPNHGKFSAAETLSQFDPSSQSVHHGDECAPPGLLESPEMSTFGVLKTLEGSPPTVDLTTRTAPPPEQWEVNKANIWTHYIRQNLPLPKLIKLMKAKYGPAMYKRRFVEWGWSKYKPRQAKAKQAPTFSILKPSNSSRHAPSGRFSLQNDVWPLRSALIPVDSIPVKLIMDDLLTNVSKVYHSRWEIERRWKVDNPFRVLEDEYDNLFVKVVSFANDSPAYRSATWKSGIGDIFNALDPVMEECGLFALPTIWTSVFRLLKAKQPQAAIDMLLRTIRLARIHDWDKPFQHILQLLPSLVRIVGSDITHLQDGLREAYRRCLDETGSSLSLSKLTLLSLRGFFVNYVDKQCSIQQRKTLAETKDLVEESRIKNGVNSSTTLDIMGQYLFILQSHPVWEPELERVAVEIDQQIKQLRLQKKGPLDAELSMTWKDARHVLAEYYYRKDDVPRAISTLKEYMTQCAGDGDDGFDHIAKTKLDLWSKNEKARLAEQNEHYSFCNQFCSCPWRGVDWDSLIWEHL